MASPLSGLEARTIKGKMRVPSHIKCREKSRALGRSPNDGRLAVDPDYGMIAGKFLKLEPPSKRSSNDAFKKCNCSFFYN